MKACWKKLVDRRKFVILVILALPVIMGQRECYTQLNITCQQVSISLEPGKCAIVYPPCANYNQWQLGDTYYMLHRPPDGEPYPAEDLLTNEERVSNGTTLRRVCLSYLASTGSYQGFFDYTFQTAHGGGNVFLSVFDEGLFSVGATLSDNDWGHNTHAGDKIAIKSSIMHGIPPYSITFTANGVLIPPSPNNPLDAYHHPTRNTEYKVTVTDSTGAQASDVDVMFVTDNFQQPHPSVAVSPSGTVSVNQPVTLTPSGGGISGIVQWQWDFDWRGDDSEAFEQTINGSNGSTTAQWITGGTKYIRVRATDAQGNFGETFVSVRVQ